MFTMTERDLQQHVMILGWLYVIANALFLLIGLFVFVFLAGIGAVSGERDALIVLTLVGMVVGTLLCVLALPGLIAAYGLLQRKNWGRILAIVVAILGLANVPLGTVVGLYALWVLLQPVATDFFDGQAPVASPDAALPAVQDAAPPPVPDAAPPPVQDAAPPPVPDAASPPV